MDQGIHLLDSKSIIDNKHLSLIGPSTSKTYLDRQFFTGPVYYYVLALLGFVTSWNPLYINAILIVIDYVFIFLFIIWLRYKFGNVVSIYSFCILVFSKYFIFHHSFFWNPHFLIILSICAVYFLDSFLISMQKKWIFLFSLFFGIAFGFHYAAIFWIIPALMIVYKNISIFKIKDYSLMFFLFILGNIPFYVFELRHGFYNLKTSFLVLLNSQDSGLTSHYFVFPLIIFLIYLTSKIFYSLKYKNLIYSFILVSFFIGNTFYKTLLPPLNYQNQLKVIDFILKDGCPKNFNITQTLSGDSRAYNLRFLLSRLHCQPNSVNDYPFSETIYLISSVNTALDKETIWEVNSGTKLSIVDTYLIDDINIYKLGR